VRQGLLVSLAAGAALLGVVGQVTVALAATWVIVPTPNPGSNRTLYAGAMSATTDAWAVGYSIDSSGFNYSTLAQRWNGSAWSVVPSPNPSFGNEHILKGVADLAPGSAWAVGYSQDDNTFTDQALIERWNGTSWSLSTPASDPNGSQDQLYGAAGASASDVWAVGSHFDFNLGGNDGLIEHWNGSAWQLSATVPAALQLTAAAAISGTDAWAAGQATSGQALLLHWDGTSWTAVSSPTIASSNVYPQALSATGTRDVWMVGYQESNAPRSSYRTLIEHWNGTGWSVVPSPNPGTTSNLVLGVTALSTTDAWAAGYYYTTTGAAELLLQWNGSAWTVAQPPAPGGTTVDELTAVMGVAGGTVLAAGRADSQELGIETTNG